MRFFTRQTMVGNDLGRLLIRLIIGGIFLYHGAQKLFGAFGGPGVDGFAQMLTGMHFPFPGINAWLASLAEFGGGVCLVLGLLMRLAIIPTIFTMLVAYFIAHGGEFPMSLAVTMFGLALIGPGRWSLDHLLFGKRKGRGEEDTVPNYNQP